MSTDNYYLKEHFKSHIGFYTSDDVAAVRDTNICRLQVSQTSQRAKLLTTSVVMN